MDRQAKTRSLTAAAGAVVVTVLLTLTGCGAGQSGPVAGTPSNSASGTPSNSKPATTPGTTNAGGTAPGATASGAPGTSGGAVATSGDATAGTIRIDPNALANPDPVQPGAAITVVNSDDWSHRISADDGTSFNVYVPAGGDVTFQAPAKPGRYPFHSDDSGRMGGTVLKGTITVLSTEPSDAARMVCSTEARDSVAKILALPAEPATTAGFSNGLYTCTYALPAGKFVMSVQESADNAAAQEFGRQLAASLGAAPVRGLSNLGFPAYRSEAGSVVFVKDNMTLHVDATGLPSKVGPHGVGPADFAFEMATTILACWTEHH